MGGRKTKKQKIELSQAEIWDDSALVQSWDDALAEYKKYHSIHAQGKTINDVIKNYADNGEKAETVDDAGQMESVDASQGRPNDVDLDLLEDGELEDDEDERLGDNPRKEVPKKASVPRTFDDVRRDQHSFVPGFSVPGYNGAQDEALKNLMMSWYYAGYYTGLYEGQALTLGHPAE